MAERTTIYLSDDGARRRDFAAAALFDSELSLRPRWLICDELMAAYEFVHRVVARGRRASRTGVAFNVHRATLTQLAGVLARQPLLAAELALASPLACQAILRRVVASANDRLAHYRTVAATRGFSRVLLATFEELRLERLEAEALAALEPNGAELAELYRAYDSALRVAGFVDQAALYKLAISAITQPLDPIVLLDVDLSAGLTRQLVNKLADQGTPLTIVAPRGEGIELLAARVAAAEQPGASALEQLKHQLFLADAPRAALDRTVSLLSLESSAEECAAVAEQILELASQKIPGDEIAIFMRDRARYLPLVEEALGRAGIPYYLSAGATRPDPAGRALLLLLRCRQENLSAAAFVEFLSLQQLPTERATSARWERAIARANITEGLDAWRIGLDALRQELQLQSERLPDDDPYRYVVEQQLEDVASVEAHCLPILERLLELPEQASFSSWVALLGDLAGETLRQRERVCQLLDELAALGEQLVSLAEVVDLLGYRLANLVDAGGDRPYGRVFVGDVEAARARVFHTVFVVGIAERVFPRKLLQDPVLLDEQRRVLAAGLRVAEQRQQRERQLFRAAIGAAEHRVVLCCPQRHGGRVVVPSFYLLEAARLFDVDLASYQRCRSLDDRDYDLDLLAELEAQGVGQPVDPLRGSLAHLHDHRFLIESLRLQWQRGGRRLGPADGLWLESPSARDVLRERALSKPQSVSGLERFVRCPYQFYLGSVLRLRPSLPIAAPVVGIDAQTRGELLHRLQFLVYQRLRQEGSLPLRLDQLEDALQLLDEVSALFFQHQGRRLAQHDGVLWRQTCEALMADLRGWLRREADGEPVEPIAFEYAFGVGKQFESDHASSEQPAQVEGVQFRGAIDLIVRRGDRGLRVVDYKTGRPDSRADLQVRGRLQRVLYGMCYEALNPGELVVEGELYYCTQIGSYNRLRVALTAELREQAARLLSVVLSMVEQGRLPAAPEPDCSYCDYLAICGRDAASRWRGKNERKRPEGWLADLQRIRGR
ncbi:MAG: PD-(D/E)XK nuclease family protein [Deltaproteobacteria bacterium]|nr:PD-(D/E)XK nuclease family protein [Deltaproteobacteria bacterium]